MKRQKRAVSSSFYSSYTCSSSSFFLLGVISALLFTHCTLTLAAGNITTAEEAESKNVTEKPRRVLTGIPQKDYLQDPNLPRELKGYDLSDYPFYKRVPNIEFNFTCDDRHDGFYASIPHKCQVYHHCLFGVRYDFLCANYTAFDQSNFICHFASEVDCPNSEFYYSRNDALYKEETTTTTTTAAPQIKIIYVERPRPNRRRQGGTGDTGGTGGTGGRRKKTTPKPTADEYYYEYEENAPPAKEGANDEYYYDDYDQPSSSTTTTTTTTTQPKLRRRRPNQPIRTRPEQHGAKPLESNDYLQYDTEAAHLDHQNSRSQSPQNQKQPQRKRRRRRKKTTSTTTTTTTTTATPEPEYYDEYYYDEYEDTASSSAASSSTTTTSEPTLIRRRPEKANQPTAHERRQALLQSRRSQVQRFVRQNPSPSTSNARKSKPTENQYDEAIYEDYAT